MGFSWLATLLAFIFFTLFLICYFCIKEMKKISLTKPKLRNSSATANPISIMGTEYCFPDETELCIKQTDLNTENYFLTVYDKKREVISWDIEMYDPTKENNKFLVFDDDGETIMTLQDLSDPCKRWEVYRGNSTDEKDVLFTAKAFRLNTGFEVYLSSNKEEDGEFDFSVEKEDWFGLKFVVKEGRSSSDSEIVAYGNKTTNPTGKFYNVNVSTGVDCGFIVALTMIFDEISGAGAVASASESAGTGAGAGARQAVNNEVDSDSD